ncbi:MAG: DNA repair protein RadC [Bacteroidaceae bacterium]|nr:DNA repair protein RadC [Bacteroidaceae bacterium]
MQQKSAVSQGGIKNMKEEERPRERLLNEGADSLSDAELLAILIGSGSPTENAVTLMGRILEEHGKSLDQFCRMTYEELVQYKGIGPAKAITLLAALQLAERRARIHDDVREQYNQAEKIFRHLKPVMQDEPREVCRAMVLDQSLHLVAEKEVSSGGLTSTVVDPRVLLKLVLVNNGVALVLAHNHPSGSLRPSAEDDRLTRQVLQACQAVGIRLVDHIIVTAHGYYSYAQEGKI